MTDEIIDNGQAQDQSTPSTQQQDVSQSQQAAKTDELISKARLNEIVHERTREASQKAYERGRAEAETKRQEHVGLGGMQQLSEEKLLAMMENTFSKLTEKQQQEYQKQAVQKQLDDLANSFMGKIEASKDKYPDLGDRRNEISELWRIVPYINETDEVAGITQHLLDNEHTVASLLVLSEASPARLRSALAKIASSIKNNETAVARPRVNEPLGQLNPSVITMDNDSGSIEALKRQDWLRG